MLDLDGLKALNDTHGHAAGDLALRERVLRSKACLGANDCIARLSGDEFAIFLPEADESRVREVVAAIRQRLAAEPVPPLGFRVAASLGIATAPADGVSLSQLLQAADAAMYADKRARRAS
jgi:diguanylate cyclase (GGDEF)-like protein